MLDAHTVTVQGLVQYLVIAELLFEIYHLGFNTNSILCQILKSFSLGPSVLPRAGTKTVEQAN